jgi:hypothetical protein
MPFYYPKTDEIEEVDYCIRELLIRAQILPGAHAFPVQPLGKHLYKTGIDYGAVRAVAGERNAGKLLISPATVGVRLLLWNLDTKTPIERFHRCLLSLVCIICEVVPLIPGIKVELSMGARALSYTISSQAMDDVCKGASPTVRKWLKNRALNYILSPSEESYKNLKEFTDQNTLGFIISCGKEINITAVCEITRGVLSFTATAFLCFSFSRMSCKIVYCTFSNILAIEKGASNPQKRLSSFKNGMKESFTTNLICHLKLINCSTSLFITSN